MIDVVGNDEVRDVPVRIRDDEVKSAAVPE